MKQQKKDKTNVMRLLDAAGISYRVQEYEVDENDLSGIHVANQIGEDPDSVFKTLVLKGEKRGYLVCCIPVAEELDVNYTILIFLTVQSAGSQTKFCRL